MILEFIHVLFGQPHPMGGKREEVGRKPVHAIRLSEDLGYSAAFIPQRGGVVEYLGSRYRVLEIVWKYSESRDHRVVVDLQLLD